MGSRGYSRRSSLTQLTSKLSIRSSVKIVLLGRLGSGKSAMTVRFVTKRYISDYHETLESYHRVKHRVEGEEVNVDILDTANRDTTDKQDACMMWGDAFLLVYSVTSRESFEEIKELRDAIMKAKENTESPIVIVGNKKDLVHGRQVSRREGRALGKQLNCPFQEISTAASYGEVESVFKKVIKRAVATKKRRESLEKVSHSAMHSIKSILGKSVGRNRAMSNSGERLDDAIIHRSSQTSTRRTRAYTCPSEF